MKLAAIATALALLITIGAMSLSSSPAMAQGPPMDTYDCTEMKPDAAADCQGENDDQDNGDDSGDGNPNVQEVEPGDNQGSCVSDLWSIISGNASSGNC